MDGRMGGRINAMDQGIDECNVMDGMDEWEEYKEG